MVDVISGEQEKEQSHEVKESVQDWTDQPAIVSSNSPLEGDDIPITKLRPDSMIRVQVNIQAFQTHAVIDTPDELVWFVKDSSLGQ